MANPIVAAAQPVGNPIARQVEQNTTSTTALGFMPPARAVLAAIGTIIAVVPLLDRNVVIITDVTQNTDITKILLGLFPKIFKTIFPTNSPAPDELSALEITSTPATIHIISRVKVEIAS